MIKWIALAALTLGLAACSSAGKKAEEKKTETKKEMSEKKAEAKAEAKAETSSQGKVMCEMKGDKRYIEVVGKESGCELLYTKFDKEEVVATSAAGTAHCEKISERIQGNLKEAGFTCGN